MIDLVMQFNIVDVRRLDHGGWRIVGSEHELIMLPPACEPEAGMELTAYGANYWGPYRAICLDGVPIDLGEYP